MKPQAVEVVVEARSFVLPLLPESVKQARRDYPIWDRAATQTQSEVEGLLRELYREALHHPMPIRMMIPARQESEALALARVLMDTEYVELQGQLLDRWNGWQSSLADRGLADPREAARMGSHIRLMSIPERGVTHPAAQSRDVYFEMLEGGAHPHRVLAKAFNRKALFSLLAVDGLDYASHRAFVLQSREQADQEVRGLAGTWAEMARHLRDGARAILDRDLRLVRAEEGALESVLLEAKLAYLERVRVCLWFSKVVWAHLASVPVPRALESLQAQ